jgi:hypothetical protein
LAWKARSSGPISAKRDSWSMKASKGFGRECADARLRGDEDIDNPGANSGSGVAAAARL